MMSEKKIELINCLDLILALKPVVFKIIGQDYFKKEYMLLEKLRNKIYEIEMKETEIDRLRKSALSLLIDLNFCILNKRKIGSLLN